MPNGSNEQPLDPGSSAPVSRPGSGSQRHARDLATLVAVLFASWTIWTTQLLPHLPSAQGAAQLTRAIGIRVLLWVIPCAIYLWLRYRSRALSGLRLNLPPTLRHWLLALGVTGAAAFAVSLDVARKLNISSGEVWALLVHKVAFEFPTAPLFEELIFRGVILAELLALLRIPAVITNADLASRQRAWLANLAASTVFVGLHWPWWIYTLGFGREFFVNTAGVMLISLVLGMLFFRSRSLWPCVLLHWLNNELSALIG